MKNNNYYFCFRVKKNEQLILKKLEEVKGKSGRAEGGISKYIRDLIFDDIFKQKK